MFDLRRSLFAAAAAAIAVAASSAASAAGGKLTPIYSFCSQSGCPDGDQPYGGVTLGSSGRLLGTTGFGGKYNGGTVFALKHMRGRWTLDTLKSICIGTPPDCQSDQGPITTLVEDISGNIYGTLYFGGANDDGAVFELVAKGHGKYGLQYIHSFDSTDGSGPWELTYAGQSSGAAYDGTSPLYSTTIAGGANGDGTVFSLTPKGNTWTLQTLYNFCSAANCADGGLPYAGVIVDPSGNLYGTAEYYGAQNAGTIYELSNSKGVWSETTLYTFCSATGCDDGNGPFAQLAEDAKGNLYGTTYFGGTANDGVVFEFTPSGSNYTVLHGFCSEANCTDGSEPAAAVTLDGADRLFGTTGRGGDNNYGTIFEIAKGSFTRVYSFCAQSGCSDGGYPYGTLTLDGKGQIYGTTQAGGSNGLGEVYRLKP